MFSPLLLALSILVLVAVVVGCAKAPTTTSTIPTATSAQSPSTSSIEPSPTSVGPSFTGVAKYQDPVSDAADANGDAVGDLEVGADLTAAGLSSDGRMLTMTLSHVNPLPQPPLLDAATGDLRLMSWLIAMGSDAGYTRVTLTLGDEWEVEVSRTTLGDSSDSTLDVLPQIEGDTLTLSIPMTELGWLEAPFKWHVLAIWSLRDYGEPKGVRNYMDVLPGKGIENEPSSPESSVDFPQSETVASSMDVYFEMSTTIALAMADATGTVDDWWTSEGVSDQDFMDALETIEDQYQAARLLTPPPGFEEVHRYLLSSLAHYDTAVALMMQAIVQEDREIMQQCNAEWDVASADLQTSARLGREVMSAQ